jgi:serine/threonine-protein phosphatase 2A regulatory subunit A
MENRNLMQSLLPISVLLDEMRSDYSSTRTYCLQNLDTIALALGPSKARGLLGGFISNLLKDQDEGG